MTSVGATISLRQCAGGSGIGVGPCVAVGCGVDVGVTVVAGTTVSGGAVTVVGGWQAPNPANSAKTTRQLNTDLLVNIVSLPSQLKKTAGFDSSLFVSAGYSLGTSLVNPCLLCYSRDNAFVNYITFILSWDKSNAIS